MCPLESRTDVHVTYWKEGGLESPIPPVRSMEGGSSVWLSAQTEPASEWEPSADTSWRDERGKETEKTFIRVAKGAGQKPAWPRISSLAADNSRCPGAGMEQAKHVATFPFEAFPNTGYLWLRNS